MRAKGGTWTQRKGPGQTVGVHHGEEARTNRGSPYTQLQKPHQAVGVHRITPKSHKAY